MRTVLLIAIIAMILTPGAIAQETKTELLEIKMELLDARIKLLDKYLEEIESRPRELQSRMDSMDVYFRQQRDSIANLLRKAGLAAGIAVNIREADFNSNLYLDPYRLFEGSLMLGYERALNRSFSLELAFLGTYMTKDGGLGGGYFRSQDLEAYNEVTDTYDPVEGDMITGWGMVAKAKKYLLARINPSSRAPLGLYAAPQLLYRNLTISGYTYTWVEDVREEEEVKQHLDVFGGGVILGGKFTLMKVFAVDAYIGGMMRLSKYHGEDKFTRYKKWNNIDYSGVLPTAGISIGILQ